MKSLEFGKKCKEFNQKYRDLFGYVPCKDDYKCNQEEYLAALIRAIEEKTELATIIPKRIMDFTDKDKRF